MKAILSFLLFSVFVSVNAQSDVRAWYADGQVWVVWEAEVPLPETYAVYINPNPFTSTNDALLAGRLFAIEFGAGALKEQIDTFETFRIPDGQGGVYQLAANEGLFVATTHQSGSMYVAVTEWGDTAVTAGVNITDEPVFFDYDPFGDPVECHLQATFPSPLVPGYTCLAYSMWVDGRQNHWEGRPDFPVMGNAAKNGMPAYFIVSLPNDLDATQAFPLTVWLHGGGGNARQSLPGSRKIINIDPEEGVLLSHNDDVVGWRGLNPPSLDGPSWHFGYRKNWDPFTPGNFPTGVDTIINYTQRRYLWIDDWLIRNFNIDTARININGHSMGGAGTTAMVKCHPRHYASATVFNNGFHGPVNQNTWPLFGETSENFPTNLINRNGDAVGFLELWNLIDNCAPERDWPLIRCYHSKNDDNDAMGWDEFVVENYRKTDSLGMGVQLYWSERAHGVGSGPDFNDHWHNGNAPDKQTAYDNTAYEERYFHSDTWVPAFANHRIDPDASDPGDGTQGIGGNGSGDDWGTWGGYHRWGDLEITPGHYANVFRGVFWLEDSTIFSNDACPVDFLDADLFLRYTQPDVFSICDFSFPAVWQYYFSSLDDSYSDSGLADCVSNDLIKLSKVSIFRKGIRRLELRVSLLVPTISVGPSPFTAILHPNPVWNAAHLTIDLPKLAQLSIRLLDTNGKMYRTQLFEGQAGENQVPLHVAGLPAGMYFVQIMNEEGGGLVLKMVKR